MPRAITFELCLQRYRSTIAAWQERTTALHTKTKSTELKGVKVHLMSIRQEWGNSNLFIIMDVGVRASDFEHGREMNR